MINHIVFDMDGVLVDHPSKEEAVKKYLIAHLSEKVDAKELWANTINVFNEKNNSFEAYNWKQNIEDGGKKLGIDLKIDDDLIIKFMKASTCLYDEVKDTLEKLKDLDLILLTNGYAKYQLPLLEELGIKNYFNRIITSDNGYTKPDIRILGKNFPVEKNVLFVGDLLYQDIYLGRQIEATTCFVYRDFDRNFLSNHLLPSYYIVRRLIKENVTDKFNMRHILPHYIPKKNTNELYIADVTPHYTIKDLSYISNVIERENEVC